MARRRSINHTAPKDEDVALMSLAARYVWAYLPCYADREGRLDDKAFYLKAEILPADNVEMEAVLCELAKRRHIIRYVGPDDRKYIQIRNFLRYQTPHHTEAKSKIPAPPESPPGGLLESSKSPPGRLQDGPGPGPGPGQWSLVSGQRSLVEGGESQRVSESAVKSRRQESGADQNPAPAQTPDPLLDGMPPFGPAAFRLLFGQWPGQDNPKFNERPADAEVAFFKHINSDNYAQFVYALNAQLGGFANDASPSRRKDLGTFRTFCEERWTKYKDPAPPPHVTNPAEFTSTVADIPLMDI